MWDIRDTIVGEIITFTTKEKAIKFANKRVEYHNSEFYYRKQQHHASANCEMVVDEEKNLITIK